MPHFNKKKTSGQTNLAGGKAYTEPSELQLASLLLTSFGNDKYYQRFTGICENLERLITECDKTFCAKAIVYARKQFGMRTITHYAASVLAKYIGGEPWAKDFFSAVVKRPDDMTEIIACHLYRKQKITNAMRKGFAEAFGRFDAYALAKYRSGNSAVKLVDIANICHPKETPRNNGAISQLINGELKAFDTWESGLSAVGDDREAKIEVWSKLLAENKLGYFALLRNIRNIISLNNARLKHTALEALLNEKSIHQSLMLPFRFSTAYRELSTVDTDAMRHINRACEIACDNVPRLPGKTLVALDISGSMAKVADIAALFTAVLVKTNNCDIITFAYQAKYRYINPNDSLMTIKDSLRFSEGWTNFIDIFKVANQKYDRIVLLSDMQAWSPTYSWLGNESPSTAFNAYRQRYNPDCKIYSIDLAGYGTLQVPERDVYCLAGFSEKIFDIMKILEEDKDALLNTIKATEF